jgi:hypothetical protein
MFSESDYRRGLRDPHSLLFNPIAITGFEKRRHFLIDLMGSENTKSELAFS